MGGEFYLDELLRLPPCDSVLPLNYFISLCRTESMQSAALCYGAELNLAMHPEESNFLIFSEN